MPGGRNAKEGSGLDIAGCGEEKLKALATYNNAGRAMAFGLTKLLLIKLPFKSFALTSQQADFFKWQLLCFEAVPQQPLGWVRLKCVCLDLRQVRA